MASILLDLKHYGQMNVYSCTWQYVRRPTETPQSIIITDWSHARSEEVYMCGFDSESKLPVSLVNDSIMATDAMVQDVEVASTY